MVSRWNADGPICLPRHLGRLGRTIGLLGMLVVLTSLLTGCGKSGPFRMAPVSGKVTYSDGSVIEADRIQLTFVPQNVSAVGKMTPHNAAVEVNVSDGTFGNVTTYKPMDGAIMGHHKILVLATNRNAKGGETLSKTIPKKYQRIETTPLEIDVPLKNGPLTLLIDRQ